MAPALDRHIVLTGSHAVAKRALGARLADLSGRPFQDLDEEVPDATRRGFLRRDDPATQRVLEVEQLLGKLRLERPAVLSLPADAPATPVVEEALKEHALTLAVDDVTDLDDLVLAALAIRIEPDARPEGDVLLADPRVLELHPLELAETHAVREKSVDEAQRLWTELGSVREETIVGYGGGTTTDLTGFVAATYLCGVPWVAAPTTLLGQVDAAIGGKTGVDLREGKDLAGVFHYPEEVVIDPGLLSTLPDEERRAGMAEVVKTGLLAGLDVWDFPEEQMIRACAAFKAGVCLADPYERGRRAILGLGRTFAHALETASLYTIRHGDALALGLFAALRLSGLSTDVVETVLDPRRVPVDRHAAWEALKRNEKPRGGRIRLVLLEEPGRPVWGVERPESDVRAALDELIA